VIIGALFCAFDLRASAVRARARKNSENELGSHVRLPRLVARLFLVRRFLFCELRIASSIKKVAIRISAKSLPYFFPTGVLAA
jgi:hypothetical protein